MNPDGIPDAPVQGALQGAAFSGKVSAFQSKSTGQLTLYYSDGEQHPNGDAQGKIKIQPRR